MTRDKPGLVAARSSVGITRGRWSAALLAVLLLSSASFKVLGQSSEKQRASSQQEIAAFRRKVLQPALKMLKEKRVQFDPELLLSDDWRVELAPALARMPEMKASIQVGDHMRGVYFAATLLLPERVSLTGDTFILVQELAPSDENSLVNIIGDYRLFIFVIGNEKQYQAMRTRKSGDFLRLNVGPCTVLGIAPVFQRHFTCRGMGLVGP